MKLFKLSILAALAFVAGGSVNAQQTPDCGTGSTFKVGMVFANGLPWETIEDGAVTGYDVQIACQIARRLGFADIEYVGFADEPSIFNAILAGQITVGISDIEIIPANIPDGIALVKYNDSTTAGSEGIAVALNAECCVLYQNIAEVINIINENGTLSDLQEEYDVVPATFAGPIASLVPNACVGVPPALPARNAITNFILNKYCLTNCETSNVSGVGA